MIYKVYYQVSASEVPVREKTNTLYVEADYEREVRFHLKDRNYNIEYVEALTGPYLQHEQKSENYKVLEL
ncbi:DNA-dependent RNA polymerase auxiliary subunit epsilon family protein [Metabacillus sp. GX 13764]|uniref:DNA-dependent RNA polymerase subunit epsilon n=1 Tax=Metabacillus kandeliae TaxID=2900151 RepID=UPI001E610ED3|nr:DNA-dependent RNA polymerase auxiliary subunit epsilon family protein [Metabacillus kandeliae]MCD7033971.1 DNA-dependent RNA polymerase auxiliary subunit epsilon family protein [Metabacillus kandeliae]